MSPAVSVVIPLYGSERTIAETLESVLAQTFRDFEVVVVNDGSRDRGPEIVGSFGDQRIRMVTQENRGLAGARNTGILIARAPLIALLDADDLWHPEKLQRHVQHFADNPQLDVSFSSSRLIGDDGNDMGLSQTPQTATFSPRDIFCRNPIGNGSAPVIRRTAFDRIAYRDAATGRTFIFDETFRQSEDIECWMRLAVLAKATFGHVAQDLTAYRISASGLSANVARQRESWERFRDKVQTYAPELVAAEGGRAEAYQLRYLARRAVKSGPRGLALTLIQSALRLHPRIVIEEPVRSLVTLSAAVAKATVPEGLFERISLFIATRMAKQS
jgi:glycosyltransferase involved in cell wall biosynthesis